MVRLAAFLLLIGWVASVSDATLAQSVPSRKCSYIAIVSAVRAGQTPDVSGCNSIIVARNLQEAGFRPVREAVADADVERGLVSRVAIQDRTATIYVSTGAAPTPPPTRPAPEVEPAPAPAPPVIVDPAPAPEPPPPPRPPTADPAPSDPRAPAADPVPPDPPVATDPVIAGPPIDIPIAVNPDDFALTNVTGSDTPIVPDDSETSTNTTVSDLPRSWFDRLQDMAPWWPIPALLLGLSVIAYGIRKLWTPPAPPALYPSWEVESGGASIDGKLPAIPGWPSFSARTTIEWGGASLPEPLPTAETDNG